MPPAFRLSEDAKSDAAASFFDNHRTDWDPKTYSCHMSNIRLAITLLHYRAAGTPIHRQTGTPSGARMS